MKPAMKPAKTSAFGLTAMLAVILSGCAASSDRYPSLAVRDAERQAGVPAPAAPPPPVAPVASSQELGDILAQAREADASFRAKQAEAARLAQASRGLDVESNAYASAAAAIAELSSLRGQTRSALGRLDELETEAATTFAPLAEIRAAQVEIEGLVAEQSAVLEATSANLAR